MRLNVPVILLTILFLLPSSYALSCGEEAVGLHYLNEDLLCQQQGLRLLSSSTLDCQGHTIRGRNLGIGIDTTGSDVSIINCTIQSFDTGLVLNKTDSARLSSVTLLENTIGILGIDDLQTTQRDMHTTSNTFGAYLDHSSINPAAITTKTNVQDLVRAPESRSRRTKLATETPSSTTPPSIDGSSLETFGVPLADPPATLLSHMRVKPRNAQAGKETVATEKTITLQPDTTRVTIKIKPKRDVKALRVVEYIPKDIAPSSRTITASDPQFTVVDEDLVIAFLIGDLNTGDERIITYTIDHRIVRDFAHRPFTIVDVVEQIEPDLAVTVSLLSFLFAALLSYYHYLQYKNHQSTPIGLYTALYIAALGITTGLGLIQTTLTLPAKPTAYTLLGIIIAAILFVGWKSHQLMASLVGPDKKEIPFENRE